MKKQGIIMLLIVVVIVGLGYLLLQSDSKNQPAEAQPVALTELVQSDTHMTGKTDAKVNIVEFGDYECPACGQVHPDFKKLIDEYKSNSNFNFSFRNFPLSQHKTAVPAALAAEAAAKQGKFWEMHDMLYEHQVDWAEKANAPEIFAQYAGQLGLNVDQFKKDMTSDEIKNIVQRDADDAARLKLNHTPTIYINGVEPEGLPKYDFFKKEVDRLLAQ